MIKKLLSLIKIEIKTILNLVHHRLYISSRMEKNLVDSFHKLYFDSRRWGKNWGNTYWLGAQTLKCPTDFWCYQEIIYQLRPDVIIETGTAHGGSALFLASICDIVDKGKIFTIDTEEDKKRPKHKRINYLLGSSIDPKIIAQVKKNIKLGDKVLVILDAIHKKDYVMKELAIYSKIVTKGSYIIVEDTNINKIRPDFGEGPLEAAREFMKTNKNFVVDKTREKFYLSFNNGGYLKKVK
ncbi:MAG TPA: CmcI family methyltransferase [Candidatus Nanoarchaeia archaeon]|nr:CmcI family methyltransferase [Candidatus Nanoarchaeia archaeon]